MNNCNKINQERYHIKYYISSQNKPQPLSVMERFCIFASLTKMEDIYAFKNTLSRN